MYFKASFRANVSQNKNRSVHVKTQKEATIRTQLNGIIPYSPSTGSGFEDVAQKRSKQYAPTGALGAIFQRSECHAGQIRAPSAADLTRKENQSGEIWVARLCLSWYLKGNHKESCHFGGPPKKDTPMTRFVELHFEQKENEFLCFWGHLSSAEGSTWEM